MPKDPAQLFINTSNDPGLVVGPRVDADGAIRYPTDEPQTSNTIVNVIQYNLNTIGANNQVLINKDNVATGDAELTYDANTNILTTETLHVGNLSTAFSANLGNVANIKITGGSNGYVLKTDGSGNLTWASQTVSTPTWSSITGKPTFATVATSGDYNDLLNKPSGGATTTYVDDKVANVTWANLSGAPTLANVATSGSYADLANVPNLMQVALTGNYNDLANKPSIPSVSGLASETYVDNKIANVTYANLSGTPTFATVATSGLYKDLTYPTYVAEVNLPTASENTGMFAYVSVTGHSYVATSTGWVKLGNYDDLPDLTDYALASSVPAAQIQSDWNQTDDEQKDYIKNKPALFSGEYADLANKPSLFSGSYADLTNKPTIPTNLDSLSNVTITSATNGQVLKFNGTDWINSAPSAINPFDQNLNTTDSPTFDGIYLTNNITSDTTIEMYTNPSSGADIDIYTDWTGGGTTGGIDVWLKHGIGLDIKTDDGTHIWSFDNTGKLTLPAGGDILNSTGTSVLGGGGASTGNITFSDTTMTSSNGDVKIHFSPSASPAVEFNFASNGTLTLPGGIVIQNNEVKNTGELSGEVQITTATTQGDTEKNWTFNHNGTGALIVPEGSSVQSKSNFNITATETGFIKFTNIVDFDTNSTVDDNQISIVNPEASILDLIDPASANYAGGLGSVVRIVYGPFRSAVGTIIEAFADPGTTDPLTGLPRYQGRIDIVNPHNADLLKEFSIEHSSSWKFGSDGNLTLPSNTSKINYANGTSILSGLGAGASTGNITFTGDSIGSTNNSVNITGSNYAQLESINGGDTTQIYTENGGAYIFVNGSQWKYSSPAVAGASSNLIEAPNGVYTRSGDNVICDPNMDTVIYTSTYATQHTLKLLLCIEGIEDGQTIEDTQSCEMVVAKSTRSNTVSGTAYGLVYTSANPLATVSARWNPTISLIEITCRPTSTTNSVSVHSSVTELASTI